MDRNDRTLQRLCPRSVRPIPYYSPCTAPHLCIVRRRRPRQPVDRAWPAAAWEPPRSGTLKIQVIKARDLKDVGNGMSRMDPFTVLRYAPQTKAEVVRTTRVRKQPQV